MAVILFVLRIENASTKFTTFIFGDVWKTSARAAQDVSNMFEHLFFFHIFFELGKFLAKLK